MAKLLYSAITSLDGYVEDEEGNFACLAPDDEVHDFVNSLERPIGTYLYGRRMYEVMRFWETVPDTPEESPVARDYAVVWRAADKVVYSTTLETVSSARTRIERAFDPAVVKQMKQSSDHDLSVGGSDLAAQAIRAGLVDEYHLFLTPVVLGGGKPALPARAPLHLDLLDQHRFFSGVVHVHYAARG